MTFPQDSDIEELLGRARRGDESAVEQLLARHRQRLRQMVVVRMDGRLSARVDPSDVVQETLLAAAKRLPDYLCRPVLPFYLWLRQIAWHCLVDVHRHHLHVQKRSVDREEPLHMSSTSAVKLADRFLASNTSPMKRMLREEARACLQESLARLAPADREILILRYLEQLTGAECAAVLEISENTANQRHVRAIRRLRRLWDEGMSGGTG